MNPEREDRQHMGCGFEAPIEEPENVWCHPGYTGDRPSTCVGYTCALPEVVASTRLLRHWNHGTLAARLGGDPPADVLSSLEILEAQGDASSAWAMREATRKDQR